MRVGGHFEAGYSGLGHMHGKLGGFTKVRYLKVGILDWQQLNCIMQAFTDAAYGEGSTSMSLPENLSGPTPLNTELRFDTFLHTFS